MASRPLLGQSEVGMVGGPGGARVVLGRWLYDWLVSLQRNPDATVLTPAVGGSPWTYTNSTPYDADALVTGGTVSSVQFSRGGFFYPAGTNSLVRLNPGDSIRVTYSVLPTFYVIPR